MEKSICWGSVVAIDFETPYKESSSKKAKDGIDIDTLGTWAYVRHPWVVPYLVSLYDGENSWVGDPLEFDWASLEGRTLLAHNASFDEEVILANIELGRFKPFKYAAFHCTADLATWAVGVRSLKEAMKELFGLEISKEARTNANGKTKADMVADGSWEGMVKYALDDAVHCFNVYKKLGPNWPERESRISTLNRNAGRRGIRIDVAELDRGIKLCQHVLAESVELLPWVKRGRKEGSSVGVAEECRMSGIPCPPVKSGPRGDLEAAEEWLDLYAAKLPWVKALRDLRRGRKMLATLETLKSRIREDGTAPFSLLYWGTHTGRFAGTGGLNILNLNKEPLFAEWDYELKRGIDVRGVFIAREGKRFAIVDLSQIEPRCLNWAVGNEALLSQIRGGMAIYEAFARTAMGWTGGNLKKADKNLYALSKAQVLSLGYGAGWEKFISMALQPMYGCIDLCKDDDKVALEASLNGVFYIDVPQGDKLVPVVYDPALHGDSEKVMVKRFIVIKGENGKPVREKVYGINARLIVSQFRLNNPLVASQDPKSAGIWKRLDDALKEAAKKREDFTIEMPDGGVMIYRRPRLEKRRKIDKETGEAYDRWEVRVDIGGRNKGTYGGKLTENFCQRFARDVFIEGALRADAAGFPYVFNVYDEGIHEVDDDGTELGRKLESPDHTTLGQVVACYAQTPTWAEGLPVASEGLWSDRYAK